MWKFECTAQPKLVWEFHTEAGAEEWYLQIHPVDCGGAHVVYDDGVRCGQRNCSIPYIRS